MHKTVVNLITNFKHFKSFQCFRSCKIHVKHASLQKNAMWQNATFSLRNVCNKTTFAISVRVIMNDTVIMHFQPDML